MLERYERLVRALAPLERATLIARLDTVLPDLWQAEYLAMPGATPNLLTVTFGDESRAGHFCRYLFDHASDEAGSDAAAQSGRAEDRVVAVWGTSRREEAGTRDTGRMKGFLKGVWSRRPGYDRGHFFAHTMGGGLDINLFPQAARVNRGGLWRRMERYCAANPGTFCFIRPIYADTSWRPERLEYGVVKMEGERAVEFWGYVFENK